MAAPLTLARRAGSPDQLLVRLSSRLNLAGARSLAKDRGPGHHVATVLCDRMERSFSTALFDDLPSSAR